jgi:hypothetical protein
MRAVRASCRVLSWTWGPQVSGLAGTDQRGDTAHDHPHLFSSASCE